MNWKKNAPGQSSNTDYLDKSQALSNAERFQDDPSSLGSSPTDKGTPPQSPFLFEMEKADELTEKTSGPPSGADQLDDKSQAPSNSE